MVAALKSCKCSPGLRQGFIFVTSKTSAEGRSGLPHLIPPLPAVTARFGGSAWRRRTNAPLVLRPCELL